MQWCGPAPPDFQRADVDPDHEVPLMIAYIGVIVPLTAAFVAALAYFA